MFPSSTLASHGPKAVCSTSSNKAPAPSMPEDIRLKCAYYSAEIKTQVDSLFDEQHKWLEDHLVSISDTLVKIKEKKAGTRAVMAGIIKTPSRKRVKTTIKKKNKSNHAGDKENSIGSMLLGNSLVGHPLTILGELKRSHLNISTPDLQKFINEQVEKQHKAEVEGRLKQDLSILEKHYESPTKKGNQNIDRHYESPQKNGTIGDSFSFPHIDTIQSQLHTSHKSNSGFPASLSQQAQDLHMSSIPLNTSHSQITGAVRQVDLAQKATNGHGLTADEPVPQDDLPDEAEPNHSSGTSTSTGGEADQSDVYATAGHELSAIQEGEEEEDHAIPPLPPPPMPGLWTSQTSATGHGPSVSQANSALPPRASSERSKTVAQHINGQSTAGSHHSSSSASDPGTNSVDAPITQPDPPAVEPSKTRSPDVPSLGGHAQENHTIKPDRSSSKSSKALSAPLATTTAAEASQLSLQEKTGLIQTCSASESTISGDQPFSPNHRAAPQAESEKRLSTSQAAGPSSIPPSLTSSNTTRTVDNIFTNLGPYTGPQSSAPDHTDAVKTASLRHQKEPLLQTSARSIEPESSHHDTVIDVPLNDKPSVLRNNLHTSVSSTHAENQTPGPSTRNLFTPGNTKLAMLQSPQSQWSSKASTSLWSQNKVTKTPALALGPGLGLGIKPQHGSPGGSQELNLTRNQPISVSVATAPTNAGALISNPRAVPQPVSHNHRRSGQKRTSTEAGLPANFDTHEAKLARYLPGTLNSNTSITDEARKGVEDLKKRLSKIQQDSAMYERVPATRSSVVADVSFVNQTSSLLALGSTATLMKPLSSSTQPPSLRLSSLVRPASTTSIPNSSIVPNVVSVDVPPREKLDELTSNFLLKHDPAISLLGPVTSPKQVSLPESAIFHEAQSRQSIPKKDGAHLTSGLLVPFKSDARVPNLMKQTSVGDLVAVFESKNPTVVASLPPASLISNHAAQNKSSAEPPPAQATKVESKHLEFLKGTTPSALSTTTPSHSPPIRSEPDVTTLRSESILEAPGFHDCMIIQDDSELFHDQLEETRLNESFVDAGASSTGHHSVDEPTTVTYTHEVSAKQITREEEGTEEDEQDEEEEEDDDDDEQQSEVSEAEDNLRKSPGESPIDGSSVGSSEELENQVKQDDEDDDDDDDDDDDYGEPSIEIVNPPKFANKSQLGHSQHSDRSRNAAHDNKASELGRLESHATPQQNRNEASKITSSGGLMSVFKAGAALATSWTASKSKPEVKSLQLAAAAAKKEQEDKDKKATLKEGRRVAAAEKKQAEGKARADQERKQRAAEVEKKKQEREEALKARNAAKPKAAANISSAASRQVSLTGDAARKRKIENEPSRATELKKSKPVPKPTVAPSSALKGSTSSFQPTRVAPPAPPGSVRSTNKYQQQMMGSVSSKMMNDSLNQSAATTSKIKQPSRPPSQVSQMSMLPKPSNHQQAGGSVSSKPIPSSVKGKMKEKRQVATQVEEYIELPDIDSEYSDDDESEHERKEAKLPEWAQSPALRQALENQRKVNPDDVFGGVIPPPKMDEIFRGKSRTSKFRHRTSSANWTGADQLTAMEEAEYVKRMGYHTKRSGK